MLYRIFAAVAMLTAALFVSKPAKAAELTITPGSDSLTTGVLTVASNSYGEFYAPAGKIVIRAADDAQTTVTQAFVRYFATNPSSTDLDASTREKTGVLLQEGDVLTVTLTTPGYIAIDGVTGTTQVVAAWIRE